MPGTARVGDVIGHGAMEGNIITGSLTRFNDTVGVARIGDVVYCRHREGKREHGLQTIVTGSLTTFVDGLGVARIGDRISCGAVIITGSFNLFTD